MLAIRLQRTGRSGHAQFRLIVQDSHAHPKSGRIVEYLGSYNPHTKVAQIDSEKISKFLADGAQPSDRVAKLLKKEGVKLPKWVSISPDKKREIRNPEKLRRNAPPEPKAEEQPSEAPTAEAETTAEPASENTETVDEPAKEEPVVEADTKTETGETEPAEAEKPAEDAKDNA